MMTRRKRWCGLLLSVTLCVALRPAHAESVKAAAPFSVRLEYTVPEGCPTVDAFEDIVSKRLGYAPFSTRAPERVQVLVTQGDNGTKALLSWRDSGGSSTGEQTFPSRTNDCAELVAAVGFALAVQIQLLAATEPEGSPALQATPPKPPEKSNERPVPAPTTVPPQ